MKTLLFLFILTGVCFAQTHTFPALDTSNTWSGTNDFSNVPLMRLRVATALTTSLNGDCGFDATANNWHCWNGADAILPLVPASALPANGNLAQFVVSSGKVTLTGSTGVLPNSISNVAHNFLNAYNAVTGNFSQGQPACSDLSNAAPSCSTDATNASNISSGTLAAARMNPSTSAHTYLGNNTGAAAAAQFVQPFCGDLIGVAPSCSIDATNASNISSGTLGTGQGGLGTSAASVAAHKYFGNNTGSSAVGAFVQLTLSDISAGASGSGTYDFSGATNVKLPPINTVTLVTQSAPANPAGGNIILYGDSTTGNLTCKNNSGGSCLSAAALPPLVSTSANPAASGIVRVASSDTAVAFRNNANSADVLALTKDTSDVVQVGGAAGIKINGGAALTTSNQSGSGSLCMTTSCAMTTPNIGAATFNSLAVSGNTSTSGVIRCNNNQQCLFARNAANNGDVEIASVLSDNTVRLNDAINTPSNVTVVGHLKYTGGITNSGAGMMHVRVTSCTTTNVTSPFSCNSTLTWPGTWADTNYTAVCTADQTGSAAPFFVAAIFNKTTTQISVAIEDTPGGNTATSGVLNCIGVHD